MAAELTRDLAGHIVAVGIGTGIGQDVFLEGRPPTPDKCLVLTDTGGFGPIRGIPDLRRTVQVMVRAKGAQAAKAHAWDVYGLFRPDGGPVHITASSKAYLVEPMQPPSPLGEDDKGRHLYALNLVVTTTPE